jgi:hypothetical protein
MSITFIKHMILRSLDQRGYVLLKKPEYARMISQEVMPAVSAPVAAPAAEVPVPEAEPAGPTPASLPVSSVKEFAIGPDIPVEFARACRHLQDRLTLPANQLLALYSAVRYLVRSRIPGDFMDCGEGVPEVLAVIGACLVSLADTDRRLTLFDITGDPHHRPEPVLPLWGSDYHLMGGKRPRSWHKQSILPNALVASGYPAERMSVVRYPADTMDFTRPLAFLGLTAETYEANRAAVRMLLPRVSVGGVIAVEGNEHTPHAMQPGCVHHGRDAVAEFLKFHAADVTFCSITPAYRLGLKRFSIAQD